MPGLSRGGRAGRPRIHTRALACAAASLSLLLPFAIAPVARAEVRTGLAPAGAMKPAHPATRIVGGVVTYDSSGRLQTTLRLAAPTGVTTAPAISVVVVAGVYRSGRCGDAPGAPVGMVSGLPDTFGYPPFPDPAFYYLAQIKLAALGRDVLGGENVAVSLVGESVNITATTPVFADKPWNCAWFDVSDAGDGASERGFPDLDRTAVFPLLAPGAGVTVTARTLRVRGGRVQLPLGNSAGERRGTVTLRAGRTTLARGRFALAMLTPARVAVPLTRAGRALLRRAGRVRAIATVTSGGGRTRTSVVVRR